MGRRGDDFRKYGMQAPKSRDSNCIERLEGWYLQAFR